jgi:hypothetical protein
MGTKYRSIENGKWGIENGGSFMGSAVKDRDG